MNLLQAYGPDDAANASFPECLELMESSRAAMWVDSTDAAGILASGPLSARLSVARAPVGPWENAPGGTRLSTYSNPNYQAANEAHADVAVAELLDADPNNPGTTPRPGLPGVQYVGIPEFQDVGTRCTEEISAAIAGEITVNLALDACQVIASEASQ